jgi:histidyl-tRNA synthetase
MQEMVNSAPQLNEFLGDQSREHFDRLKKILRDNAIDFEINSRLVRGMDYYNLTVFEFTTDQLGAQGTICGGGRYDYLFEQMGGKAAPAVGWAMGVERVLELLKQSEKTFDQYLPDAYAIIGQTSDLPYAMICIERLRQHGISVQMQNSHIDYTLPSFKSQFKKADASGARYALIFGHEECSKNSLTIKSLRDNLGQQITHSMEALPQWVGMLKN